MKTVLIVSNTAHNIYHYRRAVWRGLLGGGYRVVALAAPDPYVEELEAHHIVFYPLPLLNSYGQAPGHIYSVYRQLKTIYRSLRPAIILHFTIRANTLGSLAAAHCGIPSVATITGLGSTWLRSTPSRWLVSLLYRWTLPSARVVVTQNAGDQDDLIAAGVSGVTWRRIAGSGVDVQRFSARANFPYAAEKRFLFLGRMLVEKGIRELFAAWELAWREGVRGELHLVGDRSGEHPRAIPDSVWEWGLSLPGVKAHPAQPDVRPWLEQSHFVILPSYREGLSMTLLEALATETPVITTLVPGCRQLVEGAETGWGVAPRTVRPLADAIIAADRTTAADWRKMGRNGRKMVERNYSAVVVARAYLEVVASLLV